MRLMAKEPSRLGAVERALVLAEPWDLGQAMHPLSQLTSSPLVQWNYTRPGCFPDLRRYHESFSQRGCAKQVWRMHVVSGGAILVR